MEAEAPEAPHSGEAAEPPGKTPPNAPPKKEGKLKSQDMLDLMRYLKTLTSALPERQQTTFKQSDARLSMEYIIDTLEGKKGLFKEIQTRDPRPQGAAPQKAGDQKKKPEVKDIAGTLSYLGKLTVALKDNGLITALSRKLNGVLSGIKKTGQKTKNGDRSGK
jgi:hypothetical protein